MSVDEWINVHTMLYCLGLQKDILQSATWMNPDGEHYAHWNSMVA
jgi:hypothetical protein